LLSCRRYPRPLNPVETFGDAGAPNEGGERRDLARKKPQLFQRLRVRKITGMAIDVDAKRKAYSGAFEVCAIAAFHYRRKKFGLVMATKMIGRIKIAISTQDMIV